MGGAAGNSGLFGNIANGVSMRQPAANAQQNAPPTNPYYQAQYQNALAPNQQAPGQQAPIQQRQGPMYQPQQNNLRGLGDLFLQMMGQYNRPLMQQQPQTQIQDLSQFTSPSLAYHPDMANAIAALSRVAAPVTPAQVAVAAGRAKSSGSGSSGGGGDGGGEGGAASGVGEGSGPGAGFGGVGSASASAEGEGEGEGDGTGDGSGDGSGDGGGAGDGGGDGGGERKGGLLSIDRKTRAKPKYKAKK